MKQEGMHKPFSSVDKRRDLEHAWREDAAQSYDEARKLVLHEALHYDQKGKSLTGRRVDSYEEESGIRARELFPEGARVLNIGDPWQVMDREDVVNLEYETGEEADFLVDEQIVEDFLCHFNQGVSDAIERAKEIATYEKELGMELVWRLEGVLEFAHQSDPDDYPKQVRVLYDALRLLGESHRADEEDETRRELWYALMRLARGLEDVYYTRTVIQPAIEKAQEDGGNLSQEEQDRLVGNLIEDFRGKKKYRHAELVKGAFPLTDFDDASFDRIVASWSLSVHMFETMNAARFGTTLEEINRLLKPDGAAYLWPMHFRSIDNQAFLKAATSYGASGGAIGIIDGWGSNGDIYWSDEEQQAFTDHIGRGGTLIILPRGSRRTSRGKIKNRIDEAFIREVPWKGRGWEQGVDSSEDDLEQVA